MLLCQAVGITWLFGQRTDVAGVREGFLEKELILWLDQEGWRQCVHEELYLLREFGQKLLRQPRGVDELVGQEHKTFVHSLKSVTRGFGCLVRQTVKCGFPDIILWPEVQIFSL